MTFQSAWIPEALVDRDERAEKLRHTAAIRGGVDLSDARPLQMAGQGTYLPCQLTADKRLIGPEANNADIHVVEHSPVPFRLAHPGNETPSDASSSRASLSLY